MDICRLSLMWEVPTLQCTSFDHTFFPFFALRIISSLHLHVHFTAADILLVIFFVFCFFFYFRLVISQTVLLSHSMKQKLWVHKVDKAFWPLSIKHKQNFCSSKIVELRSDIQLYLIKYMYNKLLVMWYWRIQISFATERNFKENVPFL
jgi:hypothetical protein